MLYDARTVDSAQAMVDALVGKKADAGIGALSITSQREQVIDFSHPFHDSGLDILMSSKGNNSVFHWFEKQAYGIGLQQDSVYRGRINTAFLKLFENHTSAELDKKWFGEPASDKPVEK